MWINLFLSIAFWRIFGIFSSDGVSPVFHAFDTEAAVHGRGSINSNGGTYLSNQRSLPAGSITFSSLLKIVLDGI